MQFNYGLATDGAVGGPSAESITQNLEDGLLLLKLHGSLNWGLEEEKSLKVFNSFDDVISAGQPPHLVPPTWEKSLDIETRAVWNRAIEALRSAARVIIIGFYFRQTDAPGSRKRD